MRGRDLLRHHYERGSAVVELAVGVLMLAFWLVLAVEVGAVVVHQVQLTHVTRVAVRQAAVDPDPKRVVEVANAASTLKRGALHLQVRTVDLAGTPGVEVRASYEDRIDFPFSTKALLHPSLHSRLAMQVEDSPAG